jgi:hypothetical protein
MPFHRGAMLRIFPLLVLTFAALSAPAQSGNAGAVHGTVTDPSGAVIPGATVHLTNELSGFERTEPPTAPASSQSSNVPFNPYRLDVSAKGFASVSQNMEIRSSVGTSLKLVLQIAGASQTVTVESGGELVEDDPTFHTDVDRDCSPRCPGERSLPRSARWSRSPPRRRGRLQRPVSRPGRPRVEFLFSRRPSRLPTSRASLLQPASIQLDSIHRGDQRRAAG